MELRNFLPPELDDYFRIRSIKWGAEPVESLRDQIRGVINGAVKTARAEIKQDGEAAEEERPPNWASTARRRKRPRRRRPRGASYAKAESMFENNESLFSNLRL